MTPHIGMQKVLHTTFEQALEQVPAALKSEGFGILTEIDVQKTLHEKLGADMRRYRILGACNPPFANQSLTEDLRAGLMMPCNVVVYETDDGEAMVLAVDPTQTVAAVGSPKLSALADELKQKLGRALQRLE